MKKTIKLTEQDLTKLIKRVINENMETSKKEIKDILDLINYVENDESGSMELEDLTDIIDMLHKKTNISKKELRKMIEDTLKVEEDFESGSGNIVGINALLNKIYNKYKK